MNAGDTLQGRYTLRHRLGEGGMSSVWLADDSYLQRQVALKILRQDSPDLARRMRQEAQVLSRIESPQIAPVYDSGEIESGETYIAMKYIPGETLDKLGALPANRARHIFAQILEGLEAAHEAGVIHRDIKPSNVVVEKGDRVYLVDFGVARDTKSAADLTQTGTVIGTAHYLSPEQAHGERASSQSDIYSLGVMLYEALTGKHPWPGENSVAQAIGQALEPADPPSQHNTKIDSRLDQTVLRAIAYRPDLRFRSADEFRLALLDKSPLRRRRPWALLLLLPLLLLASWIFWQSGNTTVPDLTGKSLLEARKTLSKANLRWQTRTVQSRPPSGRVIRIEPKEGASLRGGSTVTIWVSSEPATKTVPPLSGVSLKQGNILLRENGLRSKANYIYSSLLPQIIVRSEPEEGTSAPWRSTVTLWVSQGSLSATAPNCIRKSESICRNLASKLGISVTKEYQNSSIRPGYIADQFPEAGRETSRLKIYISKENSVVAVPDLIGLQQSQARAKVTRLGAGLIVSREKSTSRSGIVIRQYPAPGSEITQEDTITLFVGR